MKNTFWHKKLQNQPLYLIAKKKMEKLITLEIFTLRQVFFINILPTKTPF